MYVDIGDKAPYDRDSLDRLVARLDQQMAAHRKRNFAEKARVLDYFRSRATSCCGSAEAGGLPVGGVPDAWIDDDQPRRLSTPAGGRIGTKTWHGSCEPLPAKTPAEALKTFETVDGFRMELVAAEPLVQSPVAAAFDADGNLYVAEMRDYPYKPKPGGRPLGTVRLLRDTDGDGRFDESHVFADGLLWAAGIAPWKGGVFVDGTAGHLVPEGHRRRRQGRRPREGLHRFRHPEPAGDGEQPDLGARPQDLRRRGGQRRDDPAGRTRLKLPASRSSITTSGSTR